MFLEKINNPSDVKKINIKDLQILADEVRNGVINRISNVGGHKASNLGMVEMTVALHYVFSSPVDKIVFDVSHQCYCHKILTGRKEGFLDKNHFKDVTGYTNPKESCHDIFKIGHSSTSISLALGLAKGRDLNDGCENIIVVIGDGALTGGEALEGLNYAGEYNKNLIIIVNDNDQSIAENHGGVYKTLKKLRENHGKVNNNFFESFGLEYHYLDDGHDIKKLISLFEMVKDIDHPVVLHIRTIKGKGLKYAEENKEVWHSGGPFNVLDGSLKVNKVNDDTVFESLKELLDNNDKAVLLCAAMPLGLGFSKKVREEYVNRGQFIDVGIAEENAVAIASGIARNGGTAVFGTYASFFQRTYDQISHDLCLNNSPATMLLLRCGVYGMNSDTHIALCDIQMFSHIPNLVYIAPSTRLEYNDALKFATSQKKYPVAIRVPVLFSENNNINTDYSKFKNKVLLKGKDVAIFGVGKMIDRALAIAEKLKNKNINATVVNPLFLSSLDEDLLNSLKKNHKLIVTLEDGELFGGYGQNIASFYGTDDMFVKNYGISKKFHSDFEADELLDECGMSVFNIVNDICEILNI